MKLSGWLRSIGLMPSSSWSMSDSLEPGDPRQPLQGREPATRVLDRVHRLQARAVLEGRLDLLLESVEALRAIIEDPDLEPRYALAAANELVNAESALAQRSRDDSRYRSAIDLYAYVLVENPDEPMGRAQLHAHRAGDQVYRMQSMLDDFALLPADTSASVRDRLTGRLSVPFTAVSTKLRAAIELAGANDAFRADYLAMLGEHLSSAYDLIGEDHFDEGVLLCREAVSLIRMGDRFWRYSVQLQLATCLWMRWDVHGAERDRAEAYRIAKRLMRRGNAFRARAGELLQLLATKPVRSGLARAVVKANLADLAAGPTRVADAYASAAEQHSPAQLADAYSLRGQAVVREAMRREVSADRLRVLAESPRDAAAAARALGENEQPEQAAIVLEHSRAILLTSLAGEPGAGTRARLLAAGRAHLLERYSDARRRFAQAVRDQNAGRRPPARPLTRGGEAFSAGSPTPMEFAEALLAPIAGEVARITGLPDPLDLPNYAMIDDAAVNGPVLYLATAADSGYALVIRRGHRPQFVPLPGLRSELVDGHVSQVTRRPPSRQGVRACVEWLADALRAVAANQLTRDQEASIVPVGTLSLLPVSAALTLATGERPDGPVGIRYLPNARWAGESTPWRGYGGNLRTLVIDVADAPGERPLRLMADEAAALTDGHGARLPNASIAEALVALPAADVVEFLCHASSDPADPLESGLYLRDGRLTVRTLLARPPTGRQLVIFAACETNVVGTQVPDEIIGLPLAFLQAGASGVIATQWRVNEQAALALLRRFREELAADAAPARALAVAQHWLARATWGDLADRYPSLMRDPLPSDPAMAGSRKAMIPFADPLSWAAFCYTGS